jgi:Ca-activated chloride channel family protein
VQPGDAEIRYITGQGRKVLGRRDIKVRAPDVSVTAQASVLAGSKFAVTWKGPANAGDYITIVPKGTPDGQYRNYADVAKSASIDLAAPMEAGDAEIRYMTGKHAQVLARRAIVVTAAAVSLEAAEHTVVGAPVQILWTGPNNPGDYITLVMKATPDGHYGNYTNTAKGSPLSVLAPMRTGEAELRYMSGQGAKVLARRVLTIDAAKISLQAPGETVAGVHVSLEWSGPNNPGDYITVVPKTAKDGVALGTVYTARGSPARVMVPRESGACEIRYMSGQGNLVLARTEIVVK